MASKESSDNNESVRKYKEYVEKKLHNICLQIVNLVTDHVLPNIEAYIKKHMLQFEESYVEERAFFYKIVGDYYRYASEATTQTPLE